MAKQGFFRGSDGDVASALTPLRTPANARDRSGRGRMASPPPAIRWCRRFPVQRDASRVRMMAATRAASARSRMPRVRTLLRRGLRVVRMLRSRLDFAMALVAGLVALAGIAGAADRQHPTADAAGQGASPILFRLDRPGRASSYVFGTLHSADPRVTGLAAKIERTMRGTRTLAVEAQLGPGDIDDFFRAAQLPEGHELGDWMPPDAVTEVERALGGCGSAIERAPAEAVGGVPQARRSACRGTRPRRVAARCRAGAAHAPARTRAARRADCRVRFHSAGEPAGAPALRAAGAPGTPARSRGRGEGVARGRSEGARPRRGSARFATSRHGAALRGTPRGRDRRAIRAARAPALRATAQRRRVRRRRRIAPRRARKGSSPCCAHKATASRGCADAPQAIRANGGVARRRMPSRSHAARAAPALKIADLRTDYRRETLDERDVAPDPFRQFEHWLDEAHPGAAARADRHDARHRRRRRPTRRAHRAAEGRRRERLRLLHELREPQGCRARAPSARRAAVPLGGARAAGAHRRRRRESRRGGIRRLFREPSAALPSRCVGVAAERADRGPQRAGSSGSPKRSSTTARPARYRDRPTGVATA